MEAILPRSFLVWVLTLQRSLEMPVLGLVCSQKKRNAASSISSSRASSSGSKEKTPSFRAEGFAGTPVLVKPNGLADSAKGRHAHVMAPRFKISRRESFLPTPFSGPHCSSDLAGFGSAGRVSLTTGDPRSGTHAA